MIKRTAKAILMVTILGLAALPSALAEDEATKDDSPAGQAYRDAWWAETSSGALDQAIAGYRKAVDAEGPATVRAQALYRMAVVLERIGKTEDAIRALERLAKDFPDQASLQVKAKERLEAWTAVDLRTNFEEWYRKFQYSPEFQARIVDLVLKLGAPDNSVSGAASQELLIIGEAAVPALKAHLASSNGELRGRAVDLLLALGHYPPAEHLVETNHWQRKPRGWRALLRADAETRERMLAELEDLDARQLRHILEGPSGWAKAIALQPVSYLLYAILDAEPSDAVVHDLLAQVGTFEGRDVLWNGVLADSLFQNGHVTHETARAWLALPIVSTRVAGWIERLDLRDPMAWRALTDAMNALQADAKEHGPLFRALLVALQEVPEGVDLSPAVRAYERVAPGRRAHLSVTQRGLSTVSAGPPLRVSRFLEALVDQARDPKVAEDAVEEWVRLHKGDADASHRLLAWAKDHSAREVTREAAKAAGLLLSSETLDAFLDVLADGEPVLAENLLRGLLGNRMLRSLPWSDERILDLHAFARKATHGLVVDSLQNLSVRILGVPENLDQFARLALKVPRRLWTGALLKNDDSIRSYLARPEYVATLRSGFLTKWKHWPLEDRLAALHLLGDRPISLARDDEIAAFLRAELRTQMAVRGDPEKEAWEREVKQAIFGLLPEVDLDDARQAFDLSTAEGALDAWSSKRLPLTTEVYEALASALLESGETSARSNFLKRWIKSGPPPTERMAARDMAADANAGVRRSGLAHLLSFQSSEDVPLFREALKDPDADVRLKAAEALSSVYDKEAVRALVEVLEDPDSRVRDQVLKTLERIRSIEEKKEYWRDFAEKAK